VFSVAQTNINIRMDENLKRDFDALCSNLGLTMTAAFTVFAKAVVRQQGIPFEISMNIPNAETLAAIEEVQVMENNLNKRLYNNFSEILEEVETDV
jgi:DNA-damage-inducible protein J